MLRCFDEQFSSWVKAACLDWGYDEPPESFYAEAYQRLPEGVRILIAEGVKKDLIITQGHAFSYGKTATGKVGCHWFSKYSAAKRPSLNWEYFIQAAIYTKIYDVAKLHDLVLRTEDRNMDMTLSQGDRLYAYIEVKERSAQLKKLITGIKKHQNDVDLSAPDRRNDALRKAKHIITSRPEYFCCYSTGARFDFRVRYDGNSFALEEDIIDLI